MENKALFYKSHIPDISMQSISYNYRDATFKSISRNICNPRTMRYNGLSWMSNFRDRQFKEIRNSKRRRQISALCFIFLPPGFSYLFSYYDTYSCKLTEDLSKLIPRYSYAKQSVRERYAMNPNEEELEFGYTIKRGVNVKWVRL